MLKTAGDMISGAQSHISCLDVVAAKKVFDESIKAVIVDVREADSAAQSKLSQSVNISRGLLEMKVPGVVADPDTIILTHCAGGGRASLAAYTLKQMGYTNVHAITATYDDIKSVFG
jgi:rhodanese-related sulfurtransferase